MPIPDEIIAEIKYRNDIESVILPYVDLKRRGKNLVGLCPFHNEKTPSFTVYPENGSFYCFGCHVGGDCFTFTRLIENLDYIEAVKLLAERSGITIPEDGYDNSVQKLKRTILDINHEAAKFYNAFLYTSGGKWALQYLLNRGLSPDTIKHFGLGCAPDSWDSLLKHLKSKGFSDYEMVQANVVTKGKNGSYYDRFRNRVMFPIIDLRGNVIAFSGRAKPEEEKQGGKYVNTADTPVYKKSQNLFGINFAKNSCSERIILVEGNMDVISLHQAGFTNTVAPLGTAFTEEQAKLLSRYTKEIVVTLDADTAGQKAVVKTIDMMKNSGIPIRVLVLPECKDPDEFIKKNGAARFEKLINGAISDIEYSLLKAVENINTSSDDGRIQYLIKAAEILSSVDDVITRDLYVSKLSEQFGIAKSTLETKIKDFKSKNTKIRNKKEIQNIIMPRYTKDDVNPERQLHKRAAMAEECFLVALMQNPDLYKKAVDLLKPEQMVTSLNKRLYFAVSDLIESGRDVDVSYLGQSFTADEMGYIVMLQNSNKAQNASFEVLKSSAAVILEENLTNNGIKDENLEMDDWLNKMNKLREHKKGE